jgi:hypothetical protein
MLVHTRGPLLTIAAIACLTLRAMPLCAQDFGGLKLSAGDIVYVTSPTAGTTVRGAVTRLSTAQISVDARDFPYEPGLTIARDGDPLWNGFAIGLGVGAILGVSIGAEACLNAPKWQCAAKGGLTMGALGALIDFARRGRTVIFKAPAATRSSVRLAPLASGGLSASVSF